MFIHLGANIIVPTKEVIAIIDVKMKKTAESMVEFLDVADEEGFVINIDEGETKSYVITSKNVYFSPISSMTLKKRISFI